MTESKRWGAPQVGQDGAERYLSPLLVLGTYLFLGVRFFRLISQYAVNVFFEDQWDFDDATLFQHHSLWEMFRWEHAPHRQGLGALLQKLIEPWLHWNSRYEGYLIGVIIVGVAVLALFLKVRICGPVSYSDVVIPLLFFTPLQFETVVVTPNPSHGSLPSLLIVFYCLCWLIRSYRWKYICVLLVNFFSIYTGFGIFISLVTPTLLVLDYYGNTRHLAPKYKWYSGAALMVSLASLASFFVGYRFKAAVDCFSPAPKNPILYPWFAALMFANAAGLRILTLPVATLIGSIVLLLLLVALSVAVRRLLERESDTWPRDAAITALSAYSVVFCLNAAYGRLCLGLAGAGSPRYTPYVVLGLFGLYLYALSNRHRGVRVSLILVVLAFGVLSSRPMDRYNAGSLEYLSSHKRAWRECYLAYHDIYECDVLTHFKIYPDPEATHLQEKLDFLERNHLNLYDNSQ
jgi:hypothetical protein